MTRRFSLCSLLLALAGLMLFLLAPLHSQPPEEGKERPRPKSPRGDPGGNPRRGPGRGGFRGPPAPPVLSALDKNGDGQLSAEELKNAAAALKTLDKNKDGSLAGPELEPDFGPGRGRGRGRGGFNRGGGTTGERVPPEKIKFQDGVAKIPDHATYQKLSYKGEEVLIDTFLAGLEFVKFTLNDAASEQRQLYFINTNTHRAHMMFARVAGLPFGRGDEQMKGVLVYRPRLKAPNGDAGLFTFEFEPFDAYSFKMVKTCYDELVGKMPSLKGRLGYYPRGERALATTNDQLQSYKNAKLPVYFDDDLTRSDVAYLPFNPGVTFGRLRVMATDDRPGPRDVVLYQSLPNELPRVAGIITSVRQTPLSHVNLRAVQDKLPNAYILNAAEDAKIKPLIGKYVSYRVTADGYEIREAKSEEVEAHFAGLRPSSTQTPKRDLSIKKIRPLSEITFKDSTSVGVKAANLASLRRFELPDGTVPHGYAVPFAFYDDFMKHNDLYQYAKRMLAKPEFQRDRQRQIAELKKFRSLIEKGEAPAAMAEALDKLHKTFPEGTSLRCRSSTNNEDLPGFSGAGLYGSYTHRPEEGHLVKSIKQVYASLWKFRAFEEREFYRVDHFQTAMGVLVHPNFKGERANGVAVTSDILYQTEGNYYVNTQVGEDLVTNPEAASIPEEGLLDWWKADRYQVMRTSNRTTDGKPLLSADHLEQLRDSLGKIHAKFARLYGAALEDERFAMEIEFKITKDNKLVVKQARPWVFAAAQPQTSEGVEE